MIRKLDKRANNAEKKKKSPGSTRHALKKRLASTPSVTPPPLNAPMWAIVPTSSTSNGNVVEPDEAAGGDDSTESGTTARARVTTPATAQALIHPRRLTNVLDQIASSSSDSDDFSD